MYGYVTPIKEKMSCADFMLYRSFYCGICKATGTLYGQIPRFTTNYDIVFLSVLLHDYANQDVQLTSGACILNPVRKKVTICRNELLDKIIAANIILSYYKACDDVFDSKKSYKKRIARRAMRKPYKKAVQFIPKVDEIANKNYSDLRTLEKQNSAQIDRVADCFATLLMQTAECLLKESGVEICDNILKLCYNVGKFVYLADALDDIDEDYKSKNYNPFLAKHPQFTKREDYFAAHSEEITFIIATTINRVIECFNNLRFTQSYGLLRNIVYTGLREKADEILKSIEKLPKPRI